MASSVYLCKNHWKCIDVYIVIEQPLQIILDKSFTFNDHNKFFDLTLSWAYFKNLIGSFVGNIALEGRSARAQILQILYRRTKNIKVINWVNPLSLH